MKVCRCGHLLEHHSDNGKWPCAYADGPVESRLCHCEEYVASQPLAGSVPPPWAAAERFLQLLTKELPPPEGQHGLILENGKIAIALRVPGGSQVVNLDLADYALSPDVVVASIVKAVKGPT